MEKNILKDRLEKLYNHIFTKKYSEFLNSVEVIDVVSPDEFFDRNRDWWMIDVQLNVKNNVNVELYNIYLRLKLPHKDKVPLDNYEDFLKKPHLKSLFIDDILKTNVYNELMSISQYVTSNIFISQPIQIL